MKMAKANEADQHAAMTLAGILEDVSKGQFPRNTDGEYEEGSPEWFDAESKEHLRILYDRIENLMNAHPGGLMRVVFGYCGVLAVESNKLVDPDADVLTFHPELLQAREALTRLSQASLSDVLAERERQEEKWGEQNHDPFTYLAILTEEVGELSEAALHSRFGGPEADNIRAEAVQVAAVALAIVECLDRGKWRWPQAENSTPSETGSCS